MPKKNNPSVVKTADKLEEEIADNVKYILRGLVVASKLAQQSAKSSK